MSAVAEDQVRSDKIKLVPKGKIRAANVVAYKHNGKIVWVDGQQNVRATRAAFDNLSAPLQDPNLGLNIAALSAADPNTGVHLLCKYPVSPQTAYFGAIGVGDEDCPVANQGPYYTGLINDPQDIMFDKYLMDSSVTGADPNDTVAICRLTLQTSYDGVQTGLMGLVQVMAEAGDGNGNGQFDIIDTIIVLTQWDPNTAAGLYTISLTLDPNTPLLSNHRGRRTYDVLNERFDPNDPTLTTTLGPACSWSTMMTGGNPQGLFVWDPNCNIPQDLVSVGTVDEPNIIFSNATDSWQWFNDTQGEQGPGFDPNFPVDSGFDGDPNSTSYLDILNTGESVFWVFFFPGGNELDVSVDTAQTFMIAAGAPACSGDVSGDGSTNITDLGILLANFGAGPGATLGMGDVSGDGFVNITDLGILLGDFGCTPCGAGSTVGAWNDFATGVWTPRVEASFADLDGDGDVDTTDLSILNSLMTDPNQLAVDPNDPWPTPLLGDFNGDMRIDPNDAAVLMTELLTAPPASDLLVVATGVGAPLGDASQLSYRFDDEFFRIDGDLQDPVIPSAVWQFTDFGASHDYLVQQDIVPARPASDPNVQVRMTNAGFTSGDIAAIQLQFPGAAVVHVFDGFVDLTQSANNLVGSLTLRCNGVQVGGLPADGLTPFGFRFRSATFASGDAITLIEKVECPTACTVRIKNCPVCVCNGDSFTLIADGKWPNANPNDGYSWQVVQGADKTNPDTGTGPSFTTQFVGASGAKKDVKIRVTYTDPLGRQCTDECTLTSVDLNVTFTAPGNLIMNANARAVRVGASVCATGAGVSGRIRDIRITTTPACDDCCRSIRVGLIQNVQSVSRAATYIDAGTKSVDFGAVASPVLDAVPGVLGRPYYPYPRGGTTRTGVRCFRAPPPSTQFDLRIVDSPTQCFRLCVPASDPMDPVPIKTLSTITIADSFRTWLVAECPRGSGNLRPLHQWNWNTSYSVTINTVVCAPPGAAVTATTATAANTHNGAPIAGQFQSAQTATTDPTANASGQLNCNGF